ncbi:MAG: hypothetical protein M1825_001495 [Sarcosagium campestre]|nr:MAG: hypothetical protein M1825_001495 [Sarcosagium campestre]
MSSGPPHPTPTHPTTVLSPVPSMTETQSPSGPFALPPPPLFGGNTYAGGHQLPAPVQLAPIHIPRPPSDTSSQHPSPSSHRRQLSSSSSGQERWTGVPLERILATPAYTPPRSDPAYSPRHLTSQSSGHETPLGIPGPASERPAIRSSSRSEFPSYPSPNYSENRSFSFANPRPTEQPQDGPAPSAPAPNLVTIKPKPRTESGTLAQDAPAKSIDFSDRYELVVRQQPLAARACGFGERDRRVIDPPPIIQLVLKDARSTESRDNLRYPFNVVHCTLWNEDGSGDETAIASQDRRVTRRLMGTLVSSPFVGKDEHDEEGSFFCFPDLSCRTHGRYRLRFVLMRIEVGSLRPGGIMPVVATALSDVFTVYTAKDFPGMRASTSLTKSLKRQGCTISVKKGKERASGQGQDEDSADDDGDVEGQGPAKRRRRT